MKTSEEITRTETLAPFLENFGPVGAAPFREEDCALQARLSPHLQRASELHKRIRGLEEKAEAVADVLESLPVALIMLDAAGTVLQLNRAASAILANQTNLEVTPRGLVAHIPSENQRLQRLIREAITRGSRMRLDAGGTMMITRQVKRSLQVAVVPLRTRAIGTSKDVPVAVVFVSDPDREPIPEIQVFAELFGLTPAEARLAQILASGGSLRQASEQLGVAHSTVRSQLKSTFAKTSSSCQSQLVRLILLTLPRIHRNGSLESIAISQRPCKSGIRWPCSHPF
jgi:DNA-binding CsgD family transcriptional regulator